MKAYLKASRFTMLLAAPACIGMSLTSGMIVNVLLGAKWDEAAIYLQWRLSRLCSSLSITRCRRFTCDQPNRCHISTEPRRSMFQNCLGVVGCVFLFIDGRRCRALGNVGDLVCFVITHRASSGWHKTDFRDRQSLESGSSMRRNGYPRSDTPSRIGRDCT